MDGVSPLKPNAVALLEIVIKAVLWLIFHANHSTMHLYYFLTIANPSPVEFVKSLEQELFL